MYIVCWTNASGRDRWVTAETIEEARATYAEVVARPATYSASITAVIESTDYSPAPK